MGEDLRAASDPVGVVAIHRHRRSRAQRALNPGSWRRKTGIEHDGPLSRGPPYSVRVRSKTTHSLTTRQRHDDRSIALHVDRRTAIDAGARRMNRHRADVLGNDIETIRNRNRRCGAPILRLQIVWLWPIAALILTGRELRRCRRRIADAKAVRENVDRADRW